MAIYKWSKATLAKITRAAAEVYRDRERGYAPPGGSFSSKDYDWFKLTKEFIQDENIKKAGDFRKAINDKLDAANLMKLKEDHDEHDMALAIAIAELHALELLKKDCEKHALLEQTKKDEILEEIRKTANVIHANINDFIDVLDKKRATEIEKTLKKKQSHTGIIFGMSVIPWGLGSLSLALSILAFILSGGSAGLGPVILAAIFLTIALAVTGSAIYQKRKIAKRPKEKRVAYPTYPAYEQIQKSLKQLESMVLDKQADAPEPNQKNEAEKDTLAKTITVQKPLYTASKQVRSDEKTKAASFRNVLKL